MTGIFTYREFSLRDTPPLDGKVALVTVCLLFVYRNMYKRLAV